MIRFTKFPSDFFTRTIPASAELIYDLSVRYDSRHVTIYGAFVRFRATGLYAIVSDCAVRMIPQREASIFVADQRDILIV